MLQWGVVTKVDATRYGRLGLVIKSILMNDVRQVVLKEESIVQWRPMAQIINLIPSISQLQYFLGRNRVQNRFEMRSEHIELCGPFGPVQRAAFPCIDATGCRVRRR